MARLGRHGDRRRNGKRAGPTKERRATSDPAIPLPGTDPRGRHRPRETHAHCAQPGGGAAAHHQVVRWASSARAPPVGILLGSKIKRTELLKHVTTCLPMDELGKSCAQWGSQTHAAPCCKIPFIILSHEFYLHFLKISTVCHPNVQEGCWPRRRVTSWKRRCREAEARPSSPAPAPSMAPSRSAGCHLTPLPVTDGEQTAGSGTSTSTAALRAPDPASESAALARHHSHPHAPHSSAPAPGQPGKPPRTHEESGPAGRRRYRFRPRTDVWSPVQSVAHRTDSPVRGCERRYP